MVAVGGVGDKQKWSGEDAANVRVSVYVHAGIREGRVGSGWWCGDSSA